MPKSTDIRMVDIQSSVETIDYRTPMKFGGRVVTAATLFNVELEVETRDGKRGKGFGSMPMGNIWAWPTDAVPADQTMQAMVMLAEEFVAAAREVPEYGHPLELTTILEPLHDVRAEVVRDKLDLPEMLPVLAQLVCVSPLEAAIHDAYGKTLGQNTYNLLGPDYVNEDLAAYLTEEFSGEYLEQYTLREPKPRMPLYHLVGALDPLTDGDVKQRINDGLPETLGEWIAADGLTHLKIKLNGDDLAWDVDRVVSIERVAAEAQAARGISGWCYSLDFNERCENVEYVLDFLSKLKEQSPAAWERVQYIEQPTSRDLRANPDNHMHRAAKLKPVVIDEALIDLESLIIAQEQGYSGVALKACKGQTGALLMAAAAVKYNLFLCVQDLTCPGASFLHSASLSARIPQVAAIEGNARQYCPAGNRGWEENYPGMFRITDGTLETSCLNGPGLGFKRL